MTLGRATPLVAFVAFLALVALLALVAFVGLVGFVAFVAFVVLVGFLALVAPCLVVLACFVVFVVFVALVGEAHGGEQSLSKNFIAARRVRTFRISFVTFGGGRALAARPGVVTPMGGGRDRERGC